MTGRTAPTSRIVRPTGNTSTLAGRRLYAAALRVYYRRLNELWAAEERHARKVEDRRRYARELKARAQRRGYLP